MIGRTLIAACVALLLALGVIAVANAERTASHAATADGPHISLQQDRAANDADDSRIDVQVWTIMAAGGAASLGLVLYLVRILLGRVQPPPPQQENAQH